MTDYKCPKCKHPGGEFDVFPSKEKYEWYEFRQNRSSCRHCGTEVGLDKNFQKWGLLILPAIVVFVWDVALAGQGGVNRFIEYASWGLACVGLVMLYLKRKLVVIDSPSNQRAGPDQPTSGR